jgi:hypothetical protein
VPLPPAAAGSPHRRHSVAHALTDAPGAGGSPVCALRRERPPVTLAKRRAANRVQTPYLPFQSNAACHTRALSTRDSLAPSSPSSSSTARSRRRDGRHQVPGLVHREARQLYQVRDAAAAPELRRAQRNPRFAKPLLPAPPSRAGSRHIPFRYAAEQAPQLRGAVLSRSCWHLPRAQPPPSSLPPLRPAAQSLNKKCTPPR